MIFVIMPPGRAARQIGGWLLQVAVYIASSALGGVLTGLLLAGLGMLVNPGGLWFALPLGLLALAYALHELGLLTLPLPNRAWQVPNTWLHRSRLGATFAFGLLLGAGLFTFIEFGSFYVMLGWEAASASWQIGALLGLIYGLARGVPVVLGGINMLLGRDLIKFNLWILNDMARILHLLDGVLLMFVAGFLLGGLI